MLKNQISPPLWHCNWNWCPEFFSQYEDLLGHLNHTHLTAANIPRVKRSELDAYVHAHQSSTTDSFLPSLPSDSEDSEPSGSNQNNGSQHMVSLSSAYTPLASVRPTTDPGLSPPASSVPAVSSIATLSPVPSPMHRTPSPTHQASSPPRTPTPPIPFTRMPSTPTSHHSFAAAISQSSPFESPSYPSLPPSPALSNMVTQALNAAAHHNARHIQPPPSPIPAIRPRASLPLPRRAAILAASSRTPPAPATPPTASSSGSSQDVERQLTQNISVDVSPAQLQPQSQLEMQNPLRALARYGSEARIAVPPSHESPPPPKRRRSRTPAAAPTTRVLRSRSKTPSMPAPPQRRRAATPGLGPVLEAVEADSSGHAHVSAFVSGGFRLDGSSADIQWQQQPHTETQSQQPYADNQPPQEPRTAIQRPQPLFANMRSQPESHDDTQSQQDALSSSSQLYDYGNSWVLNLPLQTQARWQSQSSSQS